MSGTEIVNAMGYLNSALMGVWVSFAFEGRSVAFRIFSAFVVCLVFNTILLAVEVS